MSNVITQEKVILQPYLVFVTKSPLEVFSLAWRKMLIFPIIDTVLLFFAYFPMLGFLKRCLVEMGNFRNNRLKKNSNNGF